MNTTELPVLMSTIGIACITILIPVAIAIFFPSSSNDRMFDWEKRVILDQVIGVKSLLWILLALFAPAFFWNSHKYLNAAMFIVFISGIIFFINILKRTCLWLRHYKTKNGDLSKDYRHKLCKKYIKAIKNDDEMINVWAETFGETINDINYESSFILLFLDIVKEKIKNQNPQKEPCDSLLNIFLSNIEKRELAYNNVLEKILQKTLDWSKQNKTTPILGSTLENLVRALVLYGISHRFCADQLFTALGQYLQTKNIEEQRYSLELITVAFYQHIDLAVEISSMWKSSFPQEWKVTIANIESNKIIVVQWAAGFLNWARRRIQNCKNSYDNTLDEVARELFPETDPMWWSYIICFLIFGRIYDNNKYFATHYRCFGHIGRGHTGLYGSNEAEKQIDNERDKTARLALTLFSDTGIFTEEKLQDYVARLNKLDENHGHDNEILSAIFNKMWKHLINQKSHNSETINIYL